MVRLHRAAAFAALITALGLNPPVRADDFWVTVARGLQFAGWSGQTGDIGMTRHLFGDGWSIRTTRVLNDIQLYGGVVGIETDGLGQPTYLNTDLSVRQWLVPTARVRVATENATKGGQVVPVAYNLWFNTGAQDVRFEGQGSLEFQMDINVLGFYDIDAFISNRGQFEVDGLAYSDKGTLDYDLGPVSLSGNIFADALAALTAPVFANSGTSNPFAVFSGRAKLQNQIKQRDELVAKLEAGQTLTDEEMAQILSTTVLESAFGGGSSDLLAVAGAGLKTARAGEASLSLISPVPEPFSAGLWMVATGVMALAARRRVG